MSKTMKKLLSLLIVFAMVIAMAPVGGLEVFAADGDTTDTTDVIPEVPENVNAALVDADTATEGMQATCPVCGSVETWTVLEGGTAFGEKMGAGHYYLAESLEGTVSVEEGDANGNGTESEVSDAYLMLTPGAGNTICLHLNGNNITCTDSRAMFPTNGTTNIMGEGTVSGTKAGTNGAALHLNSGNAAATVNLYGGTYTKDVGVDTQTTGAAVFIGTGIVNVFDTVTITGNSAGIYGTVFMSGTTEARYAELNMYGGTIEGSTMASGSGGAVRMGSSVSTPGTYTTLNVYDGTIQNGDVSASGNGGNIACYQGTINISGGKILNGKSKYAGGNIFMWGGYLDITGGEISGGTASSSGGNIQVVKTSSSTAATVGPVVSITGGEISDGTASSYGGNISTLDADVTYGGDVQILDGTSTGSWGGNVYFNGASSTLNITGGKISGGTAGHAANYGSTGCLEGGSGNLYVHQGTCTISGGEIDGDIILAWTGATISGNPVIKKGKVNGLWINNSAAARYLTLGTMTGGASVLVTPRQDGAFAAASDNATSYAGYFYAENGTMFANSSKQLSSYTLTDTLTDTDTATDGIQAVCPGCGASATWTALPTTISAQTTLSTGTHYYLAGTTTASSYLMKQGTAGAACLHLNGQSFTSSTYAILGTAGTLNIMGTGTVQGSIGGDASGAAIRMMSYYSSAGMGTVNLYGGTYKKDASKAGAVVMASCGTVNIHSGATVQGSTNDTYGAVQVADRAASAGVTSSTINLMGGTIIGGTGSAVRVTKANSTFNLYRGTITGGSTTSNGGGVWLSVASTYLNIHGGTIQNGVAASGGNIYSNGGTVNMYAGTVTGGLANGSLGGGNCYFTGGTVANLAGGTISDGDADMNSSSAGGNGGNFYLYNTSVTIGEGMQITGGNAEGVGGSFSLSGGTSVTPTVTMNGGTISGGVAANGGNICVSYGTFTVGEKATVSGGDATYGGNFYVKTNGLVTNNGTIKDGVADNGGGNVYMENGAFTMNGGKLADGTTETKYGGNAYVYRGTFTLTDGEISGGTATYGGSIALYNQTAATASSTVAELVMTGGKITGGTATTHHGGNLYISNANGATWTKATITGGEITEGTAQYRGGNIYIELSTQVEISGTAKVTNGKAVRTTDQTNGGNIAIFGNTTASAALTIGNGAQITGGSATADPVNSKYGYGGNLYISYANVTISGKVADGVSDYMGGNMYLATGAVVELTSTATVENGKAVSAATPTTTYGGNIGSSGDASLTVNGAQITDGVAARGGNIDFSGTNPTFIVNSGKITGGTATAGHGGNIYWQGASADVQLLGGEISGGTVASGKNGGNVYGQGGTIIIGSTSITGDAYITGSNVVSITVKDAPTITKGNSYGLYISTDLLTLGEMTGGSVYITLKETTGAFTIENANAEAYKGYFACDSDYTIENTGNVLYIAEAAIEYVKGGYTEGLTFAEDGKAWCPACQKAVEWTELNTYNGGKIGYINFNTAYDDGSTDKTLYDAETPTCYHYYLSADLDCTSTGQYAERYYSNVCINLNGHDLSFVGRMTFGTGCNVTIMGPAGSVVTSSGTYTNDGAHTEMIAIQGKCDIYAGTYKCTNTSWPILAAKWGSAKVNLYEGVTFDGENTARNTALIAVVGAGTVDIEGATIQNGNNTTAALTNNDSASGYTYGGGDLIMGGNVAIWNNGTLNVNSGTITGGKSAGQGGNIYVYQGTVNVANGATVTLGEAATYGGNIGLDYGGATLNTAGNITNGKATGTTSFGGNISATSKCVVNITGGEISGGKSLNSQGGNIRVYGGSTAATLNISGNTVIKDGHASYESGTQLTDNVWIAGNVIMNFSGGTIYANAGDTSPSSGLHAGPSGGYSPVIYLSGNASVLNNENIGNIAANAGTGDYADDRAKVIILNGWSGQASVKWPTAYSTGTIPTTEGQAGTLTDDVFTAGAIEFTGTLLCAPNGAAVGADSEGTLFLAALKGVKADGSEVVVSGIGGDYAYYKLMANTATVELTGDTYIDLNGKNLITTGTGTLYGMDSTATLVRDEDGKATVTEGNAAAQVGSELAVDVTNPVTGERYIAITEGGITTYHRLNMRITTVSLRAAKCGLYYKAIYECDDTLAGKVEGYGVVYSLEDMPSNVFDSTDVYTSMSADSFESGVVATSGSIFGIMKTYNQAYAYYQEKYPTKTETELAELANTRVANNASVGATEIYANAYIVVETDDSTENYAINIIAADNENGGKKSTDEGFTGVAYSLLEVLELVDTNWQKYDAGQSGTVQAFYQTWAELGMNEWADRFTYIDAE